MRREFDLGRIAHEIKGRAQENAARALLLGLTLLPVAVPKMGVLDGRAPNAGGIAVAALSAAAAGGVLVGMGERVPLAEAQSVFTREQAAGRYGAEAASADLTRWSIDNQFNGGRTVGAHFEPLTTGEQLRFNTGGDTVEGYLDLLQRPGDTTSFLRGNVRALTLVIDGANVPQVELRGGTFWSGVDTAPKKLFRDVLSKEAVEQPGVVPVPVGFSPECPPLGPVPFIDTPEGAAFWYGGDNWSQHAGNWTVNKSPDGKVVSLALAVRPDGHHTRLRAQEGLRGLYGIALTGWAEYRSTNGPRPVAFVADGTVLPNGIDVRGATLWNDHTPGYPQNRQIVLPRLWRDFVAQEQRDQPGTLVLPFGFNPNGLVCQVDP